MLILINVYLLCYVNFFVMLIIICLSSATERTPVMPFDRPCLLNIRQNSVKVRWLSAQTKGLPENALNISYVVEARESLAERWVCLASGIVETVYEARYLHPEKSYMFRVYAENKYGRSEVTLPTTLQARRGKSG